MAYFACQFYKGEEATDGPIDSASRHECLLRQYRAPVQTGEGEPYRQSNFRRSMK